MARLTDEQHTTLTKLMEKGDDCLEPFIQDPTKDTLMTLLREFMQIRPEEPMMGEGEGDSEEEDGTERESEEESMMEEPGTPTS